MRRIDGMTVNKCREKGDQNKLLTVVVPDPATARVPNLQKNQWRSKA